MQYVHSLEKAKEYAEKAFQRLRKENLPPTPEHYELWYVYYSQANAEITRAIDILEANNEKFTDERCIEIHEKFLGERNENERVREAGDRIQATIRDVSGVVKNVKSATTKYNTTLNEASSKFDGKAAPAEMRSILQDVVAGTKDMMTYNSQLEEKLSRSEMVMGQLQRDLDRVRKEALTDSLTSLANRKAFDTEIIRIAQQTEDNGTAFSLIMMDIDHFKSFNDDYGHQVGDQVLRLVSKTLTDGVKGRDVAARYGGEEFAILLPETNIQGAERVADYLRKAVANKEVINRNNGETLGKITLSGGVAEYCVGENLDDLIGRADGALYTAKHNGRNQISIAPLPGQKQDD